MLRNILFLTVLFFVSISSSFAGGYNIPPEDIGLFQKEFERLKVEWDEANALMRNRETLEIVNLFQKTNLEYALIPKLFSVRQQAKDLSAEHPYLRSLKTGIVNAVDHQLSMTTNILAYIDTDSVLDYSTRDHLNRMYRVDFENFTRSVRWVKRKYRQLPLRIL